MPITLILLLVVFGALVAARHPGPLAISAVMAALALVTISSHWLPVGSSTAEVVLIVGMAVGVDYSLFYLRREREERARGASFPEALRIAAGIGRAILVSGVTVMIALAGLFLTGIDQFAGIALGTIAVVGIAVAGSLTVLPALLSWLGPRADWGRIPFLGRSRAAARPSRLWAALVRRVVRMAIWVASRRWALLALAAPGAWHAAGGARHRRPPRAGRCADHARHPAGLPAESFPGRGGRDRSRRHRARGAGRGRRVAGARGSNEGGRGGGRGDPRAGHRDRGRRAAGRGRPWS